MEMRFVRGEIDVAHAELRKAEFYAPSADIGEQRTAIERRGAVWCDGGVRSGGSHGQLQYNPAQRGCPQPERTAS